MKLWFLVILRDVTPEKHALVDENENSQFCYHLTMFDIFRCWVGPIIFKWIYFPQVPFLPGAFGIDEFQDVVENALFKEFKARPHWGKNNRLNGMKVQQCYADDKLRKWRQVFQLFNKRGPFNNRFTHNVGFDSFLIDEQPTGLETQLPVSSPSPRE